MSLETDVQALTNATTDLLIAVNVSKATLDDKVDDAGAFATASLNSANASAASAATATTQATAASTARTGAETARDAAVVAQNNAVAVVTGGTATLTPSPTKIPLSDAQGKIAKGWLTNTDLVEQTDIGTAPNEIPLNQYLGEMAYMDANTIPAIGVATANLATANVTNLMQVTEVSTVMPTLNLDFAKVKQLDPRITFTRASTGTYYDGKARAKAEENLLLWSQEFGNAAWQKVDTVVLSNAIAAPDSTLTASLVTETATTAQHYIRASVGTAITPGSTFSIFFKKFTNTRNFMVATGNNNYGVFVDVSVTPPVASNLDGTNLAQNILITDVGNGWYRLSFTAASNIGVVGSMIIWPAQNFGAYLGNTSFGIYLWGAQLEQRSAATAYTPTTTQPVTNYIPVLMTAASGVPRFEHNPITGESLGLEIEEQRTNLLTYSEQFDNAAWTKSNATVTANATTAPDGTLTADKLVENTATGAHYAYQTPTLAATSYTLSAYLKAGERNWSLLNCFAGTQFYAYFNLATGTIGLTSAGVVASLNSVGNGWYRCAIQFTPSAGASDLGIRSASSDGGSNYTGNGFSGIYIWGAQLEAGAFATSYIPTTTAQVTRAADSAVMTGVNFSSWYRQDEGTVYVDVANFKSSTTVNAALLTLADNPLSSSWVSIYGTTTNILVGRRASGTSGSNLVFAISALSNRVVYSYLSGGTDAASLNGTTPATSASLASYTNTQMLIGGFGSNPNSLNGTIKKITYYPQRLGNAELVEITA